MKKLNWFLIGLVLIASIAFMGCKDDGVTPAPVDPPIVEPIPPTFEETIVGKLWSVDKLERYQVTQRSASNPYELDVCMLFGEDGMITFWEDQNDDGILSESEEIGTPVAYSFSMGILTIGSEDWNVAYFGASGWAIEADVTGTDIGDILGNGGVPYEGWLRVHYVPCMYLFDGPRLSGGFAFVFDDMGDVNGEWIREKCRRWKLDTEYDWADGFYFSSGTPIDSYLDDDPIVGVHIMLVSFYDGIQGDIDTAILIGSEAYGFEAYFTPERFNPDHVYDMVFSTDSADAGNFAFVSRVDGHSWDIDVTLDKSAMGELIMRGVDDADAPVVNP